MASDTAPPSTALPPRALTPHEWEAKVAKVLRGFILVIIAVSAAIVALGYTEATFLGFSSRIERTALIGDDQLTAWIVIALMPGWYVWKQPRMLPIVAWATWYVVAGAVAIIVKERNSYMVASELDWGPAAMGFLLAALTLLICVVMPMLRIAFGRSPSGALPRVPAARVVDGD